MPKSNLLNTVIQNTKPLTHPRNNRLPLYLWPLIDPDIENEAELEHLLTQLNLRGLAVTSTWNHANFEESLQKALHAAHLQKKLGLHININANPLLHHFCNGDPETAHITQTGELFFDTSFSESVNLGCPFTLQTRYPEIRSRIESFAREYQKQNLTVDFIFADWEIDGPIEWNNAWQASKRCTRCREHIPDIENFTTFQTALRTIRSDIQRKTYADVMRTHFPNVLVGNYAVYPHNGYRYWYDYFEKFVEDTPHKRDQRAIYRQWIHEFDSTNYTFAMPVVYTWYPTFSWYNFKNPDYRWFYNMLLVASNAAQHTQQHIPLIPFVHWHTTDPPAQPDPSVKQLSAQTYQELLWHMLLRGHDTFFLWCPRAEAAEEVRLLHEVYAAAQQYGDFLDNGKPITFHVPTTEGPVVSALQLDNRLLVRRTDFTDHTEPISLQIGNQTVSIPRAEGQCQILNLSNLQ